MLVVWSMVFGFLFFFGLVLLTVLFGAAGHKHEKELLLRTERERSAGLTGDITSDTPDPIHQRYLEA